MVGAQTNAAKYAGETQRQTKTRAGVHGENDDGFGGDRENGTDNGDGGFGEMATLTETTIMVTTMAMHKPTSMMYY